MPGTSTSEQHEPPGSRERGYADSATTGLLPLAEIGRLPPRRRFLAQVLQQGRNHETFHLLNVSVDDRPDLATRFRITEVPSLIVIDNRKVVRRIGRTSGSRDLKAELAPWLH